MRFPLASNVIRRNSLHNTFGIVRTNKDGSPRPHAGWDFAAHPGTPCYAVAAGKVVDLRVGEDYGVTLTLDIGGGRWAFYAHLAAVTVGMGDTVAEGQQVALTGNTGNAVNMHDADEHLHFEARLVKSPGKGLGGRVSPLAWFGVVPLTVAVDVP